MNDKTDINLPTSEIIEALKPRTFYEVEAKCLRQAVQKAVQMNLTSMYEVIDIQLELLEQEFKQALEAYRQKQK